MVAFGGTQAPMIARAGASPAGDVPRGMGFPRGQRLPRQDASTTFPEPRPPRQPPAEDEHDARNQRQTRSPH